MTGGRAGVTFHGCLRTATRGTIVDSLVFRSCVGRLAACAVAPLRDVLRRDRAVHVDATEGEVTFVTSLAVEVRSDFPGKEVPEPTRG